MSKIKEKTFRDMGDFGTLMQGVQDGGCEFIQLAQSTLKSEKTEKKFFETMKSVRMG